MGNLKVESPAFENNGMIPSKYTCDGQNINPPLKISGAGKDAKSLVLIMDDPDAAACTWVHWTIWNISPLTAEIAENSVPEGAPEGITNFRKPGYGGPCPPSGTHRYFFKLYALDILLELGTDATAGDIENAMQGHILESADLIGLYKRS
ncbi:MAG: YbhB/YbcL family Raf kinase inhibitor-like protein [Actinobacteria bacterium]|nr:YbhB/YbcL family Raf kinase inhibitor-like protein [Actinomycetota bacterium]